MKRILLVVLAIACSSCEPSTTAPRRAHLQPTPPPWSTQPEWCADCTPFVLSRDTLKHP